MTVVAKGADVMVREYVLDPGEFIPWHHHSQVSDRFYGLEGTTVVQTQEPPVRHELKPGDTTLVSPGTVHHVSNGSSETCRFLLVQGVGQYDFFLKEG